MSLDAIDQLVEAVLYEGYILYPYRPSSTKNRQRFTFGRVYPPAFSAAQRGLEPDTLQTQCLLHASADEPSLTVRLRFLQPITRRIGRLSPPLAEWSDATAPEYEPVGELRVNGRIYQAWQEAVERDVNFSVSLSDLLAQAQRVPFHFEAAQSFEPIRDEHGLSVGVLDRQQAAVEGAVEVSGAASDECCTLTIRVINATPLANAERLSSEDDAVLLRTFASTHVILTARNGEFISLLETPTAYADAAALCQSEGLYPVLVGSQDHPDTLLASPIILYDFPKIAPESGGDLFDSTEIDEILTLRILSMTDDEKAEMRQVDERARQLLQRTESLLPDDLMALHGTLRDLRPKRRDA